MLPSLISIGFVAKSCQEDVMNKTIYLLPDQITTRAELDSTTFLQLHKNTETQLIRSTRAGDLCPYYISVKGTSVLRLVPINNHDQSSY